MATGEGGAGRITPAGGLLEGWKVLNFTVAFIGESAMRAFSSRGPGCEARAAGAQPNDGRAGLGGTVDLGGAPGIGPGGAGLGGGGVGDLKPAGGGGSLAGGSGALASGAGGGNGALVSLLAGEETGDAAGGEGTVTGRTGAGGRAIGGAGGR